MKFSIRPALAAAGLFLIAGCVKQHERQTAQLPTASVRVQAVQSRTEAATEEVAGTIQAEVRATLEAKVSGRIEKMPILLGEHIRAGQLLARLDAAEIKARLDQTQASSEQADRNWQRISKLYSGQAVTRSEYETADARNREAKAAVAEAEAMMRYIEVVAPFDGVVVKKWVQAGDFATPGKPLVDLEDPSTLQLDADVPEALAHRLQVLAPLAVRRDSDTNELQGKVSEIAPSAEPSSRTIRVKVDLPQTPGLMSGQFARLLVPMGESTRLLAPCSSLVRRGQLEIVFVVSQQRAQLRLVKAGKRVGEQVEILSGLDVGDQVVVDGAALLTDGQPVSLKLATP